jgi:hypothetical protein
MWNHSLQKLWASAFSLVSCFHSRTTAQARSRISFQLSVDLTVETKVYVIAQAQWMPVARARQFGIAAAMGSRGRA